MADVAPAPPISLTAPITPAAEYASRQWSQGIPGRRFGRFHQVTVLAMRRIEAARHDGIASCHSSASWQERWRSP